MRIYLFLLLWVTGCATRSNDWQTYDAGPFKFCLPPDFQKTSLQGIDSYVSEFKGDKIIMSFDYGAYSGSLDSFSGRTAYASHREYIGGHEVQMASFDVDPARYDHPHHIAVSFLGIGLTMSAACETKADCQTAAKIFRTVRFKPQNTNPAPSRIRKGN